MLTNPDHPIRRLRTQLIASFLVSFLVVALALAIPVVFTMNRQAASQSRLLLGQALLSTQAFLSGEQSSLENLAILVSQRPTLITLLEKNDSPGLEEYIHNLQTGAELDFLLVCSDVEPVNNTGAEISSAGYCVSDLPSGYSASSGDIFIFASAVMDAPAQPQHKIVVGKRVSVLLSGLQARTGLTYFLFQGDRILSSSDPQALETSGQAAGLEQDINRVQVSSPGWQLIRYQDHQYLLGSLAFESHPDFQLVTALNVDSLLAVQRDLRWTIILGLLLIVLIASALGIYLSQSISQPMARLAHYATEFRRGHLDKPVFLHSRIWEFQHFANTLEDARVALQHSLTQLKVRTDWNESLLNSIVEGLVTLDHHNQITFASEGVSNIIGLPVSEIVGKPVDEVFLPSAGELSFSSQLPELGQKRRIAVELQGGAHKLLSVSKARFVPPEAENANRALVLRDVSQDEYVHRLLGDFMANITHEFRTPLAALEASVELLLDNLSSLSKDEIQELLLSLNLGIIDLQTLIDNLIESASIEAGRFKVAVAPVSFETILNDALHVIRPLAAKYSLELIVPEPSVSSLVRADHRRTVQVMVNLLSNAIKHSPQNGCIRVDYAVQQDRLVVDVIDEGSGITGEQRENIFRRFSHLDSSDERARHGAGLGLSVVKAIVEAQQGEVGLHDTGGSGAHVWFSLPLVAPGEA